MADERIEVEWIATAQKMVQVIDRVDQRLERQEAALKKLADTSKKSADGAAGSFNRLEQELKENEKALANLSIGTAEFEKQKKKVDELRGAFDRAKRSMREATPASEQWAGAGRAMLGTAAAAGILIAALSKLAEAQKAVISGAADEIVTFDELSRQYQIQAGIAEPERRAQSVRVVAQASAAGVTAEQGFRAATQLAGSGFQDAVESGALTTILDTMQASSFKGSPEELVSAFAEALNAYGLEKTNDNLQAVAVAAQSLFKQTDFQLTELQDFAKNASVFEGANINLNEALAGFTALREVLPAAESGTGLRNFVNKLQQGDLTRENKQNLERLGLKAEDVDFVGESLTDVISTIRTATDKMPEADRNAALGKMFGTENVASAKLLLQSVDRITELQDSQQATEQFRKDRDTAAESMRSELNRVQNKKLLDRIPIADRLFNEQLQMSEREEKNRRLREEAAVSGVPGKAAAVTTITGIGETIDTVTGTDKVGFRGMGMSGGGVFSKEYLDAIKEQKRQQEETNRLLAENNEILRQERQRQAQPPAPAVRPREAPLPAATVP